MTILGDENIIAAIEAILTSEDSFIDKNEKDHRELFNRLIDYAKGLGTQLEIEKLDVKEHKTVADNKEKGNNCLSMCTIL